MSAASSSQRTGLAMTRNRCTRSSRRPPGGWPRWSPRTGRKDHWLAAPFSPIGRVGRLNKISNRRDGPSGPSGPSGPTQQDFQPPHARGRATIRRRSTRSGKRFATRSSGSGNPRSHWMRPATSGSGWPVLATRWSRLTPSLMKPNRGWRRCGRPTGDDATEASQPAQPALSCGRAVSSC
jgi:hypothetical protein